MKKNTEQLAKKTAEILGLETAREKAALLSALEKARSIGIDEMTQAGERGNPYDWLAQAERDCKDGRLPVVQHKRNHHDTIFVLSRKTFFGSGSVWLFTANLTAGK